MMLMCCALDFMQAHKNHVHIGDKRKNVERFVVAIMSKSRMQTDKSNDHFLDFEEKKMRLEAFSHYHSATSRTCMHSI